MCALTQETNTPAAQVTVKHSLTFVWTIFGIHALWKYSRRPLPLISESSSSSLPSSWTVDAGPRYLKVTFWWVCATEMHSAHTHRQPLLCNIWLYSRAEKQFSNRVLMKPCSEFSVYSDQWTNRFASCESQSECRILGYFPLGTVACSWIVLWFCCTPNHHQMCFQWNFAHKGNRSEKKDIFVDADPSHLEH